MSEPSWLIEARKYVGLKEIPGPRHQAQILKWWGLIGAPFRDDETPWCAAFIGGCLEQAGVRSARSASALAYANYGIALPGPAVGSIAVKKRYDAKGRAVGGHVTFPVAVDPEGNLICLGGNQNDGVRLSAYAADDFFTFRWPSGVKDKPVLLVTPNMARRSSSNIKEA